MEKSQRHTRQTLLCNNDYEMTHVSGKKQGVRVCVCVCVQVRAKGRQMKIIYLNF